MAARTTCCITRMKRFGIETTFVAPHDLDAWRPAARPNTRLFFGKMLGNPGLDVLDIAGVAEIAHEHGAPLLVDSTVTTPYLLRLFEHGADLVYHSATKFLGGHGTTIGGVRVDGGEFDFAASDRFPEFTEPYDGFHGMVCAEESTVAPFLLRARREGLRDFGACLHPQAAWQLLQGIETLPLRMDHACRQYAQGDRLFAEFACRRWRGLSRTAEPSRSALAKRLLPRGAGAVFSFDVRGGVPASRRFIESLSLFSHLANVGNARLLVIHPASTTHFPMDAAALEAAGIGPGRIRLSIGLEDPDDLKRGLKAANGEPAQAPLGSRA